VTAPRAEPAPVNPTETLAAVIAGRRVPLDESAARILMLQAQRDRVVPLLARAVRTGGDPWPSTIEAALTAAASEHAALEYLQRLEITRLLARFAERGIRSILMKGAALAYTVYPDPTLRPHDDIDVLVSGADRGRASDALRSLGYEALVEGGGDLSFAQAHFRRIDRFGVAHVCDLHWRIANPIAFREMVTFDELDADAAPVPRLSTDARTFSVAHALFLACVHRVAHHLNEDVLLWIYDVHRLAMAASSEDLQRFEALAVRAGAAGVCARGLEASVKYFDTPLPDRLLPRLGSAAAARPERSAAFLSGNLRLVDLLERDLAALPGWRARLALVGEHLFPSADYMRASYAPGSRLPLPWLYVSRIVRGAPKWFRASAHAAN
jgi:putative nucleotidyltransferase-like protein